MGTDATRSAYEQRVHRVMDHVREHLEGDLSLEALAKVACFSPFHFHRVFKATTGETLTAFVQRARLERAAALMQAAPERRLDAIAVEVGFSAHSDFTRVFKRHFGVAPSSWDRASRITPERIVDDFDEQVAAARRALGPQQIRVVKQPARRLLTVRTRSPFYGPPLHQGYAQLCEVAAELGVDRERTELLGWSWDHYETTPLDKVCFDLGFVADEHIAEAGGLREQRFDAHLAVQLRVQGPLLHIAAAWDTLFIEWLPSSSYEPDDLPAMKVFEQRPDVLGWERYDLWCSLPVRPLTP